MRRGRRPRRLRGQLRVHLRDAVSAGHDVAQQRAVPLRAPRLLEQALRDDPGRAVQGDQVRAPSPAAVPRRRDQHRTRVHSSQHPPLVSSNRASQQAPLWPWHRRAIATVRLTTLPCRSFHISEDVFAGYNATLRGARTKFREYMALGKGRDMGFDSINAFESKVGPPLMPAVIRCTAGGRHRGHRPSSLAAACLTSRLRIALVSCALRPGFLLACLPRMMTMHDASWPPRC